MGRGEEGDTDSLGWQCKYLVVGGVGGEEGDTLTAWDGSVSVWRLGRGGRGEEGDTDSLRWQCKCLVVGEGGKGRGGGH